MTGMRPQKRDLVRNARSILARYDSLAEYLVTEWSMGAYSALLLEDWYWTRGL